MFNVQFKVSRKDWIRDPRKRWNAGLEKAGLNFRQGLQRSHYPPIPPTSTYRRTYTTANKAGFRILVEGAEMIFGSTEYLKWLLIPAVTVQHWEGKDQELLQGMQDGMRAGVRDYKG